jgi:hypothetical protein
MKGRLFVCFVFMRSTTKSPWFHIPFLLSLESSEGQGVHGLGFMIAFGLASAKVLEY